MTEKTIKFGKPVKVFQVFKHTNFYTKEEKSITDREAILNWQTHLSMSGYVNQGKLFLNEQILSNPDFKDCNLITLNDSKARNLLHNGRYEYLELPEKFNTHNSCLSLINSARIDNTIEIRNGENLELFVLPGNSQAVPKRESHKLCNVIINQPIEIKLNCKYDISGSRQTARTFIEERYVIEYLGEFQSCVIVRAPFKSVLKKIPKNTKLIDLLKPLW